MKTLKLFLLFFLCGLNTFAQTKIQPLQKIDVLHYNFHISLNDSTNIIKGKANIEVKFLKNIDNIWFNLTNKTDNKKGMLVSKVLQDDKPVTFNQKNNLLNITTLNSGSNSKSTFSITYSGIPKDGLIISKNKFGNRTFFGDNWPNRAQNWLPCVDYLSDKAYVDFYVTAPSHYQVVANGVLKEQININQNYTLNHWQSSVPLSTDVMVIGVAKFAVQYLGVVKGVNLSSWVYPQNKTEGFYDYAQASNILKYYIGLFGPYPYKKLANVQSKTRFGGMENASNIFYSEKSVTGKRNQESLLAHEIVHQWFGDSATETDWPHLWLSEGFATYFTNVYLEKKYGRKKLNKRLKKQRLKIIAFSKRWQKPVIDTQTTQLMKLLNANSYEKGGWFLHMLRRKLGDMLFFKSIKTYYNTYKLKNANTSDFRNIVEKVSGKNLKAFFNQWLYQIGQPKLNIHWTYNHNNIQLNIEQIQNFKTIFTFPLSVKFIFKDQSLIKTFNISQKMQSFELSSKKEPLKIELDPNTNLLFEKGKISH